MLLTGKKYLRKVKSKRRIPKTLESYSFSDAT